MKLHQDQPVSGVARLSVKLKLFVKIVMLLAGHCDSKVNSCLSPVVIHGSPTRTRPNAISV